MKINIKATLSYKYRLKPIKEQFVCPYYGHTKHRDIQSTHNILRLGLESFGLGTNLTDLNHKAFRSVSSEIAS